MANTLENEGRLSRLSSRVSESLVESNKSVLGSYVKLVLSILAGLILLFFIYIQFLVLTGINQNSGSSNDNLENFASFDMNEWNPNQQEFFEEYLQAELGFDIQSINDLKQKLGQTQEIINEFTTNEQTARFNEVLNLIYQASKAQKESFGMIEQLNSEKQQFETCMEETKQIFLERQQSQNYDGEYEYFEQQLSQTQQKIQELNSQLPQKSASQSLLQKKIYVLQTQLRDLQAEKENTDLDTLRDDLRQRQDICQQNAQELSNQKAELEQQQLILKQQKTENMFHFERMEAQQINISAQKEEYLEKYEQQQQQIQDSIRDIKRQQDECNEISSRLERLHTDFNYDGEIAALQQKISLNEESLSVLQNEYQEIHQQLLALFKIRDQLQKRLAEINALRNSDKFVKELNEAVQKCLILKNLASRTYYEFRTKLNLYIDALSRIDSRKQVFKEVSDGINKISSEYQEVQQEEILKDNEDEQEQQQESQEQVNDIEDL